MLRRWRNARGVRLSVITLQQVGTKSQTTNCLKSFRMMGMMFRDDQTKSSQLTSFFLHTSCSLKNHWRHASHIIYWVSPVMGSWGHWVSKWILLLKIVTSWWLNQPIWTNMLVKLDHFLMGRKSNNIWKKVYLAVSQTHDSHIDKMSVIQHVFFDCCNQEKLLSRGQFLEN